MSQRDLIDAIILEAIREVQDMLPLGATLEAAPEAPLMTTAGGSLDSLGVVNLMVAVESRVEAAFRRSIGLAEALAERPEESPFRTVTTLAEHIQGLLGEQPHG
jgi:acyl carrier protein